MFDQLVTHQNVLHTVKLRMELVCVVVDDQSVQGMAAIPSAIHDVIVAHEVNLIAQLVDHYHRHGVRVVVKEAEEGLAVLQQMRLEFIFGELVARMKFAIWEFAATEVNKAAEFIVDAADRFNFNPHFPLQFICDVATIHSYELAVKL
jgi:hypothetical protein